MSKQFTRDFDLEVARGNISGMTKINKFGRSTDVDNGVTTDIWDRANATDGQVIWTAPTTARLHDIASSSANDDGSPAGTGARTIEVFGLTSWSTAEVSETITMNGTTNVTTVNSYVIIHRMKVVTAGTSGPNVGTITATAQTDATVTAQINAGEGQTQMAIYGIPSTQTAYISNYYTSLLKSGGASAAVDTNLRVNPEPDAQLGSFLIKHTLSLNSTGTSYWDHTFSPHFTIAGPAIIKVQATGTANNLDVSGGFDLVIVDN